MCVRVRDIISIHTYGKFLKMNNTKCESNGKKNEVKIPKKKRTQTNRETNTHIAHTPQPSTLLLYTSLLHLIAFICFVCDEFSSPVCSERDDIFLIFCLLTIVLPHLRLHVHPMQIFHIVFELVPLPRLLWLPLLLMMMPHESTPIQPRYISLTLINARCLVCE